MARRKTYYPDPWKDPLFVWAYLAKDYHCINYSILGSSPAWPAFSEE